MDETTLRQAVLENSFVVLSVDSLGYSISRDEPVYTDIFCNARVKIEGVFINLNLDGFEGEVGKYAEVLLWNYEDISVKIVVRNDDLDRIMNYLKRQRG